MHYSELALTLRSSTVLPMTEDLSAYEPMTVASVTAYLNARQPLPEGECWGVDEYVPGWFSVLARHTGSDWMMHVPWGALQFYGPGFAYLTLSSNPLIHDFRVARQVMAENATAPVDVTWIQSEIRRRTQELEPRRLSE